ncbi:hypothetical protein ESCO_003695 [Escovopsis weberi]|uniref:Uncharacterized protein n=1 Tax=Escovopsis weberi TaxID=150374 RepID=A0A0M8N0Z1_ESCWE|nr:hypothetical protein ESCO_003695 [Escovopsis weberi]
MSLRRRTSIREIFRSKSRSILVEAKPDSTEPPTPRTAYVPVNAASGFSQTFKSPRSFQTSLPITQEETTADSSSHHHSHVRGDNDDDNDDKEVEYAIQRERISRQLIRPGHLYIDVPHEHAEPEAQPGSARTTDDFRAFITAAKAQEEARLYFTGPPKMTTAQPHPPSPSHATSPSHMSPLRRQRDSGYSSGSLSPLKDRGAPSAPWQRDVDGQGQGKTLRKRQSLRLVGQLIAEYVRPMEGGPLSASHAAVR